MNATAMLRFITLFFAAALIAACSPPAPSEDPPLQGAKIGAPFTLTSGDGSKVSWSDFDGQYRMVYFGYTSCPDVCPVDVQNMARAHDQFLAAHPEMKGKLAEIFITLDPARDTPEAIAQFTRAFSPDLVGLTGSEEEIAKVTQDFAAYRALEEPDEYGFYLVQHGPPGAYLFGPEGEPIALLPVDESVEQTVAELQRWIR